MAKVAIVEIPTPGGLSAIAIEITTDDEQLTIALEGSAILGDTQLFNKVHDLIQYVKDNYHA